MSLNPEKAAERRAYVQALVLSAGDDTANSEEGKT